MKFFRLSVIASLVLLFNAFPLPAQQADAPSSDGDRWRIVARGGQLYDAWWKVIPGVKEPKDNHPLWQSQRTNKRNGSVTWRCKECHGWDYRGKDGAYATGSHKTGFPGVWDAAHKKSADELVAILKGSSNPKHNFSSVFRSEDMADIATFLPLGETASWANNCLSRAARAMVQTGKSLTLGVTRNPSTWGP